MKHLKLFETDNDYKSFVYGELPSSPNVSYVIDGGAIKYSCYLSVKDLLINLLKNKKKFDFNGVGPVEYNDSETSLTVRVSDVHPFDKSDTTNQTTHINMKFPDDEESGSTIIYMYDKEAKKMKEIIGYGGSFMPICGGEMADYAINCLISFSLFNDNFYVDFEGLSYDGVVIADDGNEYVAFKVSNETEVEISYGEEYINDAYLKRLRIFMKKGELPSNRDYALADVPIFSGGTFDNGIYHIGTADEDGYCHIDEGTANEAIFEGIHPEQHSLALMVLGRRSFDIYGRTFDTIEEIQQNFIDAREEIDNVINCISENCFYLYNGDYEEQFSTERINSLFNDGKNHDILERLFIKLPYNLMVSLFSTFDVYQKYVETA